LEEPKYTGKADVFSFAMTCYEVISGKVPYSSDVPRQSINKLVREGMRPELPKDINTKLYSLIQKCWRTEATERPTFEYVCSELSEMKALETKAPERLTETCSDLQEMKTLETIAPEKLTETCSDLQEMKALETIVPEKLTEICSDLQEMKALETIAQGRQKSWCTVS
jgi:serine/threonine protein kinase